MTLGSFCRWRYIAPLCNAWEETGYTIDAGVQKDNTEILELCYYERDLRTAFDDAALEADQQERDVKRKRGERLLSMCCDLSS